MLEELVAREPNNTRGLFYLANTYSNLGDNEKALAWFRKRYAVKHRGWWEEREVSAISIANALKSLGRLAEWRMWAFVLYFEHGRAEGVMALARHAIDVDNNSMECFVLADMATKLPAIQRDLWYDPREYTTYRFNLRRSCELGWQNQREVAIFS